MESTQVRAAFMTCLMSSEIWQRFRDEFALDGAAAGEAAAWAFEGLRTALVAEEWATQRPRKPRR